MPPGFLPHDARRIESKQHEETFLHESLDGDLEVRLLSFRCNDARQEALPCQDYALLVSRTQSSLTFCVSDGVGSSYRGDFAAHYLTNRLIGWLQNLPDLHVKAHTLTTQLEPLLHLWAEVGQGELIHQPLPPDIPEMLREILLEQSTLYGSEAVFFAGRIDYEHSAPFRTQQDRQAFFCWMGNISAQLFVAPGKYMLLSEEETMSDENRWSTRRGPRGILTGLTMNFSMAERLIVHTDGFISISKELARLDDEALQERAVDLLLLPANDDMTMLDLQWKDPKKTREPNTEEEI
jgi:hypothetical protein